MAWMTLQYQLKHKNMPLIGRVHFFQQAHIQAGFFWAGRHKKTRTGRAKGDSVGALPE
ncbi:hypothetical protein UIA24_22030 [Pseudomonas sp. AL 58]|uniref:hypothetical protein n=1 Tax=Pseudomonas sp. AL 58 TaxID=3104275 RepID=UPI002EAE8F63|nr:hypothetical protein [Pseudomonas sp. AL 58]